MDTTIGKFLQACDERSKLYDVQTFIQDEKIKDPSTIMTLNRTHNVLKSLHNVGSTFTERHHIYNVCISVFQSLKSISGKSFEDYIADALQLNHIPFKKQVHMDSKGYITHDSTSCLCKIDFVLGSVVTPGEHISKYIVLSTKTSSRERWTQDNWTFQHPPLRYYFITLSDDYPPLDRFIETDSRFIVTMKAKAKDHRKTKLSLETLIEHLSSI